MPNGTQTSDSIETVAENKSEREPCPPRPSPTPGFANWCVFWWKPILAEFTSTALLITLGCMTCSSLPNTEISALYIPLGFGFVVLLNVQIFGHISGAFMNPSVSLAAVLWGCIPISVGVCFVIAQCLGAIAGYGLLIILTADVIEKGICITEPLDSLKVPQSLFIEMVLTTVMNLMNCGIWDPVNKDKQDSVAIKLGLAIAGLSFAGGPLTGASMNPARTLAPAVWTQRWNQQWIYWIGPLIGAILPVYMYKYLFMTTRKDKNTTL